MQKEDEAMANRRYREEERIKNYFVEWRQSTGLTQAQVEAMLGWGPGRLSPIEKGRALVTEHVLRALSRAYACEPAQLLAGPPPAEVEGLRQLRRLQVEGLAILHEMQVIVGRWDRFMAAMAEASGLPDQRRAEGSLSMNAEVRSSPNASVDAG